MGQSDFLNGVSELWILFIVPMRIYLIRSKGDNESKFNNIYERMKMKSLVRENIHMWLHEFTSQEIFVASDFYNRPIELFNDVSR